MHLKKFTGILEKNSQEIRFGLFGPKTRNSQPPLLPSRCVTALDRVAGLPENYQKNVSIGTEHWHFKILDGTWIFVVVKRDFSRATVLKKNETMRGRNLHEV